MIYKIVLICMLFNISLCGKPPVLIWGSKRSDLKPSLNVITRKDFSYLIKDELEKSMVVAFVEKELSNEDLSHCKTKFAAPCYKNITEFTPQIYYTKVDDPVNALRNVADKKEYVEADVDGNLNNPVSYEHGKVVFVNFKDDVKDTRETILHDHDSIIAEVYRKLSNLGKVMAVYTSSEETSHTRQTRQVSGTQQASDANKPSCFKAGENLFLICFTELKKSSESKFETVKIVSVDLKNNPTTKAYDIALHDDKENKLTFSINFVGGYWKLTELKWSDEQFRVVPEISVPEGFSYYCGISSEYIGNKKMKIQWSGLQMQPFQEKKTDKTLVFGDPWHCVGFTSAGIWAGLFVTFMLLGILSIGISWLLDIKTMDRFDDPKGKTITINATD